MYYGVVQYQGQQFPYLDGAFSTDYCSAGQSNLSADPIVYTPVDGNAYYYNSKAVQVSNERFFAVSVRVCDSVPEGTQRTISVKEDYTYKTAPLYSGTAILRELNTAPVSPVKTVRTVAYPDVDLDTLTYEYDHMDMAYSNPNILAVLAAPPAYKDLEGLKPGYASSNCTSSTKSQSQSVSASASASVTAGAYMKFEQEVSTPFGQTLASVSGQVGFEAGISVDYAKTLTKTTSTTFSTYGYQDTVALAITPMEIFHYNVYYYDEDLHLGKTRAVYCVPYTAPITTTMPVENYNEIAAANGLDRIGSNIVQHTAGYPATYTTYNTAADAKGNGWEQTYLAANPITVGVDSGAGSSSAEQSLEIATDSAFGGSISYSVKAEASAGVGGFEVGASLETSVSAGLSVGFGDAYSYTGSVANMPAGTDQTLYGYSWALSLRSVQIGANSQIPYVTYATRAFKHAPLLPKNFQADEVGVDKITLRWDPAETTSDAEKATEYRIYQVTTGDTDICKIVKDGSNTFMLDGLDSYTDYAFYIRAYNSKTNASSCSSDVLTVHTLSANAAPIVSVAQPVVNTYLCGPSTLAVSARKNAASDSDLAYQWQKMVDGVWTNVDAANTATLYRNETFPTHAGTYRCMVMQRVNREDTFRYSDPIVLNVVDGYCQVTLSTEKEAMSSGESCNLLVTLNCRSTETVSGTCAVTIRDGKGAVVSTLSKPITSSGEHAIAWRTPEQGIYYATAVYTSNPDCQLLSAESSKLTLNIGNSATLVGDSNANGSVSIADLVFLARYVAEDDTLTGITPEGIANSDTNHDGLVNSSDITTLSRFLAHLISSMDA